MAWAKLDDQIFFNRKITCCDGFARLMHVAGIVYCAGQLTDGFVPDTAIGLVTGMTGLPFDKQMLSNVLGQLLSNNLWSRQDDGYVIHDYLDYNPSRETILTTKEARKLAGKAGGEAKALRSVASANQNAKQNAKQNRTPSPYPILSTSTKETAPDGADPSRPKFSNADRGELERYFCELTCLEPPKYGTEKERRTAGTRWVAPEREIYEKANGDMGRAKALIQEALADLDGMTIEAPASILKTVKGIVAKEKRGDASGRLQPKPTTTVMAPMDGSFIMPVGSSNARR